jgi:hypothetical protein
MRGPARLIRPHDDRIVVGVAKRAESWLARLDHLERFVDDRAFGATSGN